MRNVFVGGLVCLLTVSALITPMTLTPEVAYANSSNIKDLEKEKKSIEKKKKELDNKKNETESKIEENKENLKSLEEEMESVDLLVIETEEKIAKSKKEIVATKEEVKELAGKTKELEEEIELLNEEIDQIQIKIDVRAEILGKRLQVLQMNGGGLPYIEVLLGSASFSELIQRASAIKTIVDNDNELIAIQAEDKETVLVSKRKVLSNKREIEFQANELKEREADLKKGVKDLVVQQEELDEQVKEKEKIMKKLKKEQDILESTQISAKQEEKLLESQSAMVESIIKQQKENPGVAVQYSFSGDSQGILISPSVGRLSSQFGVRTDPITGAKRTHNGMDIAAPTGTPIVSAASGTVTHAKYTGGFGNVIFVYHPHLNLTTVYAHLSKYHVKVGQKVSVGERIADMGSTGRSTGPHLHFEVHKGQYGNGNAVDPRLYVR